MCNTIFGTRGRTRTGTVFTPVDFESTASTNFATLALICLSKRAALYQCFCSRQLSKAKLLYMSSKKDELLLRLL